LRNLSFYADPREDRNTIKNMLPYFRGTLVGIDINIEDDENFNRLIEAIGKAYQLNVKKESKNYYKRINFS
jgi:hypothetical protein